VGEFSSHSHRWLFFSLRSRSAAKSTKLRMNTQTNCKNKLSYAPTRRRCANWFETSSRCCLSSCRCPHKVSWFLKVGMMVFRPLRSLFKISRWGVRKPFSRPPKIAKLWEGISCVLNNILTKSQIDKRRDGAWARAKVRFLRFRQKNTHTKFVLLAREINLDLRSWWGNSRFQK